MKSDQLIIHLCSLLEEKTFWGPIENWTDKNFRRLSTEIAKSSDIVVSSATLKRITGKVKTQTTYHPQEASLDGICKYLGYESWEAFRHSMVKSELMEEAETEDFLQKNTHLSSFVKKRKTKYITGIILIALTAVLLFAGYYFITGNNWWRNGAAGGNQIEYQQPVSFYYTKPSSDTVPPFDVILHSDIEKFAGYTDPLKFILFKGNIIPLYNNRIGEHKISIKSYGIHVAKLFVENHMISQLSILVPTSGWLLKEGKDTLPAIIKEGHLETYAFLPGSNNERKLYTAEWYGKTGVSGNNFTFETKFTSITPHLPGREDILLAIHTEFNKFNIELVGKNTGAIPFIKFGDISIDREKEGFSSFRQNLSGTHKITLINSKGKSEILLDGKEIYSGYSSGIMGEIQGLNITSRTGIKVDYINLFSKTGKYSIDF